MTPLVTQQEVRDWVVDCFGEKIHNDKIERAFRFLEEALELFQSIGCNKIDAQMLVDYVFSRPTGETEREVGQVLVTYYALCSALKVHHDLLGRKELDQCWDNIDKIRAKGMAKRIVGPSIPGTTT